MFFGFEVRRRVARFGVAASVPESELAAGVSGAGASAVGSGGGGGGGGAGADIGGVGGGAGGGGGGGRIGAGAGDGFAGEGVGARAGPGPGAVAALGGWPAIGVNSPGRHVCGWRRTAGSFTNRSACPQFRQMRVPIESSPPRRRESSPRPSVPVLRSFAQTKSLAPQLLHVGGTEVHLPCVGRRALD